MLSYHSMYGTCGSGWAKSPLRRRLSPVTPGSRAVEDQSSFVQRDRIGVDNIMLEADYPHCDSTCRTRRRPSSNS